MVTELQQKEIEKKLFLSEYGELNLWKINLVYNKVLEGGKINGRKI